MSRPLSSPEPALLDRALAFLRRGKLDDAAALYEDMLRAKPDHFDAQHFLGVVRAQQGRHGEALALIAGALKARPDSAPALSNYGLILHRLGRHAEALASFDRAIALAPGNAEALNNRGNMLAALARPQDALASYERALAARPDYPEAWHNRGNVLAALDRCQEALASYERGLALKPAHGEALYRRGNVLARLGRHDEALASYDCAIALDPGHAEALDNRGNALIALHRPEEALASYEQALAIRPSEPATLSNRGIALEALRRDEEALASHDAALALRPEDPQALGNRGNVLWKLGRYEEAVVAYDRALALNPDDADAFYNRGNAFAALRRYELAAESYRGALRISPGDANALAGLTSAGLAICDWQATAELPRRLAAHIERGESALGPFALLTHSDDPALLLRCAQNFVARQVGLPQSPPQFDRAKRRNGKIRIAYLSADFRGHVMAYQVAELIERHDRARFEVLGVSFAPDDGSAIRARLIRGFDRFLEVRAKSDREVAQALRALDVDIAIDLMGHTRDARLGILAQRAAPIQVSYLGYAGTSGAEFIDYILGDPVVLPFAHQPFYRERIVQLPDSFFATDSQRPMPAPLEPSRASGGGRRQEAGLPEQGFVFCCFNNAAKLNPAMFDIWMRLLAGVPGSVLWLSPKNASAERNLREEARRRGVDAARLVFAPRVAQIADHLARHRLADLFLDTLPYNAHATAGDALWAGLPVLTCLGASFAARVGGSLVRAVGLPELVTASLADYEALALRLARDRALLACLRERLERNRAGSALFDPARLARHIEAAYATMWDIWQKGEAPRAFQVEVSGENRDADAAANSSVLNQ
jgi:protein O-GlcNAc transferase